MKPYALKKCLEILRDYFEHPAYSLESRIYERRKEHFISNDTFTDILRILREIVRWHNKIHFVAQKTLRSLNWEQITPLQRSELYYCIYRLQWEKSLTVDLQQEFDVLHKTFADDFPLLWDPTLGRFLHKIGHFSWDIALQKKPVLERISILEAVPSYFIKLLHPVMSELDLEANSKAMNPSGDDTFVFLRIVPANRYPKSKIKTDKENCIRNLNKNDIQPQRDPDIPFLLKIPLQQLRLVSKTGDYKEGKIIFQDKAAILACLLVDPQPADLILDVSAAPGMKTSLIQELTDYQSVTIAGDIRRDRLKSTQKLLKHLKTSNVHLVQWDGSKLPLRPATSANHMAFDRVLFDAPCSGSGTFLNEPEMKWHQNEHVVRKNVIIQQKILKQLKHYVKKGGTLIYTTCSLYPEEGEYQIKNLGNKPWFQEYIPQPLITSIDHPYSQRTPAELHGIGTQTLDFQPVTQTKIVLGCGRVFPAVQHAQGFFYAKFKRTL